MTVYLGVISLRSEKHLGRCMKHSKLVRVAALVAATSLIASCGSGSESSDTTERTRNSMVTWSATTEPIKSVIFGTQDGLVDFAYMPTVSSAVNSTNIYAMPTASTANGVSLVAVDSARSEIVFGGVTSTSGVQLSKIGIEGSTPTNIFSNPTSSLLYGGGYDPSSRLAVFAHFDKGSMTYVINSIDEPGTTLLETKIPYYGIPLYDGSRGLLSTGSNIREISITSPTTAVLSTPDLPAPPFDMWGFVKDPLSDAVYGANQGTGEILVSNLDGSAGAFTQVGKAAAPASLAAFSDGTLVVGSGASATSPTPESGSLTIVDPSGALSNITLTVKSSSMSSSAIGGVQSVWAVESPISTAPPTLSTDSDGNLVCSDASWRGDLPLSRLSRAPIASARSYGWFLNGAELSDEVSETLVVAEDGEYSCAVIAGNIAGIGNSALSNTLKVEAPTTTSTTSSSSTSTIEIDGSSSTVVSSTTSVAAPGGSESSSGASPVVTVPTVSPGTPITVTTPSLRSAKWTFKGRTAKVTFRKWSGASKYRLVIAGATKKTIQCKSSKTTVTCTTTTLKRGINSFSAKALSRSNVTLALSTKSRNTK
jgi:hypothetical protein